MSEPRSMITVKGEAKQPQYFAAESVPSTKSSSPIHNVPAMIALAAVGVGVILFLRSRSNGTSTGPALTVTPDVSADSSGITNLTNSIVSLQAAGLIYNPNPSAPVVGGGVSTPITTAG